MFDVPEPIRMKSIDDRVKQFMAENSEPLQYVSPVVGQCRMDWKLVPVKGEEKVETFALNITHIPLETTFSVDEPEYRSTMEELGYLKVLANLWDKTDDEKVVWLAGEIMEFFTKNKIEMNTVQVTEM